MRVTLEWRPQTSSGMLGVLLAALDALTLAARDELEHRDLPPLYSAGVRYQRETPAGRCECWRSPLEVLAAGGGDCDDLGAWRAAELQLAGVPARAVPFWAGPRTIHVIVLRQFPDGRLGYEDPSARLGMPSPPLRSLAPLITGQLRRLAA